MAASPDPSLLYVTDFSDASLEALHWAIPEALKHHLHFSVLYPFRLDQVRRKDNAVLSKKDIDRDASEKFEGLMENLLKSNKLTYDFHSEVGFLRDRIADHIRKNNVAMLVIGKNQVSEESFPELVQELNIPLVIVPSKKRQ
ncbi:MAG: universal stress protein [Cyclobacteriaceae bacterium]|nr:universal stress protein [Cyclobacteriaceae bacterium]